MKYPLLFAASLAGLLLSAGAALADVSLPHVFSDHMVLQQNMPVPVWGTASPGEKITISFNGQKVAAAADKDGKWMAKLSNLKAGGPFELTVSGSNTVTFKDVLVGEVWLASGQSNMDFTVAKTPKFYFAGTQNEEAEVAAANYPQIRMFSGNWTKSYEPQTDIQGQWKICNPENVKEFSAIGYFFARDLQKELKVPVGIITETFGASTIESWIRRETLAADPALAPILGPFDAAVTRFRNPPTPIPSPTADERTKINDALKALLASDSAAKAVMDKYPAWNPNLGNAAPATPAPRDPSQDQHNPIVMYNGMIAPVVPYAIQGVLWYQGESIVEDATRGLRNYALLQTTLIKDWRKLWGREDLPFYIVQLAALGNGGNNLPNKREVQETVLAIPHTGMATSIDIADATNVHPKNKQDVGDRLTRIALANVYGRNIEYYGPVYDSLQVEGAKIRLKFTHLGGGLVAKGGDLQWFTIAGADGNFVPAKAVIEKDTVVVSSPDVPAPANVRYAWDKYPLGCNLYNVAGLPAFPFRTDKK